MQVLLLSLLNVPLHLLQHWGLTADGLDADTHALDLRTVALCAERDRSREERQRAAYMEEV